MARFCTVHGEPLGENQDCPMCAEMSNSDEKNLRPQKFVDFAKVAKIQKEFCQKCGEQRIKFDHTSCEYCDSPFPRAEVLRIPVQQGLQSQIQVLSKAIYLGGTGANFSPKTLGT